MKRQILGFVGILAGVVIFIVLLFYSPQYQTAQVTFVTKNKEVRVAAEVADTFMKREVGLMNRESLPYNSGMLFAFDDEAPRSFWMKNTLIPLDMVFISKGLEVVGVVKNAQPCSEAYCQQYHSNASAMYVIEVNGGFTEREGVKTGDKVLIG